MKKENEMENNEAPLKIACKGLVDESIALCQSPLSQSLAEKVLS